MASIVTVNKMYPEIGFVDNMYARNRLCGTLTVIMSKTYSRNSFLLTKRMPRIGYADQRLICSVNQKQAD